MRDPLFDRAGSVVIGNPLRERLTEIDDVNQCMALKQPER
jgi:hypothetical protein